METPGQPQPPLPARSRRYGWTILLILLAPIVLLGLGMAVAAGLHLKDSEGYFWMVFLAAGVCSLAGAAFICVAAAESIIARVFIFAVCAVSLIFVYTFCICAGCGVVNGPLNFH